MRHGLKLSALGCSRQPTDPCALGAAGKSLRPRRLEPPPAGVSIAASSPAAAAHSERPADKPARYLLTSISRAPRRQSVLSPTPERCRPKRNVSRKTSRPPTLDETSPLGGPSCLCGPACYCRKALISASLLRSAVESSSWGAKKALLIGEIRHAATCISQAWRAAIEACVCIRSARASRKGQPRCLPESSRPAIGDGAGQ